MHSHWVLTTNNPTADPDTYGEVFTAYKHFRYLVIQLEKAPETGTLHYQGYLELKRNVRLSALKKLDKNAHWEGRRGTRSEARDYAMKEDSRVEGPWEFGTWNSKGVGYRTDLDELAESMKTAKSLTSVVEAYPGMAMRYSNGFKFVWNHLHRNDGLREDVKVHLYYGDTGVGKTYAAITENENVFKKCGEDNWFDGYADHDVMIMDDFAGRASKVSLVAVLNYLDKYTVRLPIKGGFVSLRATKIIVTTNIHPNLWYDFTSREKQKKALARRFDKVYWFKSRGVRVQIIHQTFFDDWYEDCDEEQTFLPLLFQV